MRVHKSIRERCEDWPEYRLFYIGHLFSNKRFYSNVEVESVESSARDQLDMVEPFVKFTPGTPVWFYWSGNLYPRQEVVRGVVESYDGNNYTIRVATPRNTTATIAIQEQRVFKSFESCAATAMRFENELRQMLASAEKSA